MANTCTKRCTRCGEVKAHAEFSKSKKCRDGLKCWCRACCSDHRKANIEAVRLRERRYYETHRAEVIERVTRFRKQNPEKIKAAKRRRYFEVDRERMLQSYQDLRAEIFAHYGESCRCCGLAENLTIDHVNGNGADHRRELFGRQSGNPRAFYKWLISQGFPDGYQTLCHLCNNSKGTTPACRIDHEVAAVPKISRRLGRPRQEA